MDGNAKQYIRNRGVWFLVLLSVIRVSNSIPLFCNINKVLAYEPYLQYSYCTVLDEAEQAVLVRVRVRVRGGFGQELRQICTSVSFELTGKRTRTKSPIPGFRRFKRICAYDGDFRCRRRTLY